MNSGLMVLSAASGGGHVRAAEALVSAFRPEGIPARHVEVLQHTAPSLRRLYADHYVETVNRRPWMLALAYGMMARPGRFARARLAFDLLQTGPLVALLREASPAVVLCTHFLPAEIVVHLKRKLVLGCRVGVVMTDFDVHALWIHPEADWYFVAGHEGRRSAIALGIPPLRVHVTGIPIDPAFGHPLSRTDARSRLGLDPGVPMLLLSAGGFGMGPVEAVVSALQRVRRPVQIAVLCGRNEALGQRLASMRGSTHPMKPVGYTDQMETWMAAADLLVGKAGGLTSAEALARGLVSVIVNPIPGPEESNAAILVRAGAAASCRDVASVTATVDHLLEDEGRLARMREAVVRIARPDAASKIASVVARSAPELGMPRTTTGTS